MKRRRAIFWTGGILFAAIAVWTAVVSCLGFYYFDPTMILDSEHVGVLVMRGHDALAFSVGTTRRAQDGEALCIGSPISDSVYAFRAVGDTPPDRVSAWFDLRRTPFWVRYRQTQDKYPISGRGWLCIWPPHFVRAYRVWKHNQTLELTSPRADARGSLAQLGR
jgi:hypothetical protein